MSAHPPSGCNNISIVNGVSDVSTALAKIIDIDNHTYVTGKKGFGGQLKLEIQGYTATDTPNKLLHYGHLYAKLKLFGILFKSFANTEKAINSSSALTPCESVAGLYVPPFEKIIRDEIPPIGTCAAFTLVPAFSSLDVPFDDYTGATNAELAERSPFDRIYINGNAKYGDFSAVLKDLAYELTPHIEGNTYNVLGTTELTVANVPKLSVVKYDWSFKNDKFKVVSHSGAKAVVTPLDYNTFASDSVYVTPSLTLPISIVGLDGFSVGAKLQGDHISIKGGDYLSTFEKAFELSAVPDDVESVSWTGSDGVTVASIDAMTASAKVTETSVTPWLEAHFRSYGVDHTIRKEYKTAVIDSAKITEMMHWRNPEEGVDKYYFRVDTYPATSVDELTFCWDNNVTVCKNGGLSMNAQYGNGAAAIKTDGDIGGCTKITPLPVDSVIFRPRFAPTSADDESSLPDITAEPVLLGPNEAIVSMPAFGSGYHAQGSVLCCVSDDFGNSTKLTAAVESHWAVAYGVAPNPATTTITITRRDNGTDNGIATASLANEADAVAKLYNDKSLMRQQAIINGMAQISVDDLPDGTYYLNIEEYDAVVMQQIIIVKH